jgi:hypothetical protein
VWSLFRIKWAVWLCISSWHIEAFGCDQPSKFPSEDCTAHDMHPPCLQQVMQSTMPEHSRNNPHLLFEFIPGALSGRITSGALLISQALKSLWNPTQLNSAQAQLPLCHKAVPDAMNEVELPHDNITKALESSIHTCKLPNAYCRSANHHRLMLQLVPFHGDHSHTPCLSCDSILHEE